VRTSVPAQDVPGAPALPAQPWLRSMARTYLTIARLQIIESFQYRVANYFWMIGMVAEPVIYLVVWSTVAESQGGAVGGFTPGELAAYYIVWTLVRNMNIVFTAYGWEWRIREGQLSGQLLKPLHPIHYDLAGFAGWKLVVIILWVPIAVVLTIAFEPTLHITTLKVVVFFFAIWGAYLIRSMIITILGMVCFWTTRVSALFELFFVTELLLSGRLVPLSLMPPWIEDVAAFLPFKWTFQFPILALAGDLPARDLFIGLGMQALWIGVSAVLFSFAWRAAIRRFTAVGG
jgi:viologen exporter family transport system permease protein